MNRGLGALFKSATQKTPKPVTAPNADRAQWTGTKKARRCNDMVLWGCSIMCINLVLFHDLRINSGGLEKSPQPPVSK